MIADICDLSEEVQGWLSGSQILTLFYETIASDKFGESYAHATSGSIISMEDTDMIKKLAEILQKPEFSKETVISVLKESCSAADTFKIAGKLLFAFCNCLPKEKDGLYYITEGEMPTISAII